jgi:hypothetical protein
VSSSLSQEKRAAYPVVAAMVSQFELPEIEMGEYVFAIQRWSVEGIIVRETLHFLVKKLVNGSVFSHDVAERIITTASLRGQDWLEARNTLPLEEAEDVAVELSLEVGRSRFERYSKQVGDEMIDRASVQKRTIERHLEQQRARYELLRGMHNERAAAARAAGDRVGDSRFSNLAKAAQSNLDKLLNRFEREMIRVSKASEIKVDCEDICVGVICVR